MSLAGCAKAMGGTFGGVGVNPARYREQLIRGLDDDGLEELTLRYFKGEHPDAHRTRRGIDVLSDYELPPKRGWQCKSSVNAEADWRECRKSIKAAMDDEEAPGHYTFVFNFVLSAGQRNFWRKTLLPEFRKAYPNCATIDYIDDLDRRVESRDDLLDWLTDGALGMYVRRTLEGIGRHAPSSRPGSGNGADDRDTSGKTPSDPAEYARRLGEGDATYSYQVAGREASGRDRKQGDRMVRFSMSAGQREQLPEFSLTTRDGDAVTQVSATPRDGVEVTPPQPWFAPTPDGERARATARAELAKGRTVTLSGHGVGVAGGDVPTHFSEWVQPSEYASTTGELGIGLSEPLLLTLTMDPPGLAPIQEQVPLYQVPPEPGAEIAYAGAIGGAVLAIDLFVVTKEGGPSGDHRFECRLTVTLAMTGESARTALKGLGFARAFGEVDRLHFACPGLLPSEGYEITGRVQLGAQEAELWEAAATLAVALQGLTDRDGIDRTMPDALAPIDLARAQKVIGLLGGPVEIPIDQAHFQVRLPEEARPGDEPAAWLTFSAEFGSLVGQPTGLEVEQSVIGAEPREIREAGDGALVLACASTGPDTKIVAHIVNA